MTGGDIIARGSAGREAGARMRRARSTAHPGRERRHRDDRREHHRRGAIGDGGVRRTSAADRRAWRRAYSTVVRVRLHLPSATPLASNTSLPRTPGSGHLARRLAWWRARELQMNGLARCSPAAGPRHDRQPVGRHLLGRPDGALQGHRRLLHRHRVRAVARPLHRRARPSISQRSNYALREGVLDAAPPASRRRHRRELLRRQSRHGVVVRQAGAARHRAATSASTSTEPTTREAWARSRSASASRASTSPSATPSAPTTPKPRGKFVNTWSVEGFISEGLQPSELGWGTHEKALPPDGRAPRFRLRRRDLSDAARAPAPACAPGRRPRRRSTASWSPTTSRSRSPTTSPLREGGKVVYRPTCHYAYHPCDDAVLSLHEMAGAPGSRSRTWHILDENDIVDGVDELGVLLYGHAKNAYWYGSSALDRGDAQARALSERDRPAGHVGGARRHRLDAGEPGARPRRGRRDGLPPLPRDPAALSRPVFGDYTDWTPLHGRGELFPEDVDTQRSLAVQERAGAVSRRATRRFDRGSTRTIRARLLCWAVMIDHTSCLRGVAKSLISPLAQFRTCLWPCVDRWDPDKRPDSRLRKRDLPC